MANEKTMNILKADVNDENIQEIISNSSKVTEEIANQAAENIAARRKEKLTAQLVEVVQKCEYTIAYTVLQVRRSNRVNKRVKTYLKELSAIAEDVKSGNKPISAWDEDALKLKAQFDRDIIDINADIDKSVQELFDIFPGSWQYRLSRLIPQTNR